MSTVDVIVPCYKYGHFLRECVESILSQSHRDLRVLIINDASPDNTHEVAQELLHRDSRIQYRRHPVNHGHIATFNEGLEWASGEYALLISADDMLTPGSLARTVQLMDAHPEVVLTYGEAIMDGDWGWATPTPRLKDVETWESSIIPGAEFIRASCEQGTTALWSPTVVVRTDVQHRLGGFLTELPHSADTEIWLRFAARGSIGYINAPQAYYRRHTTNMSRGYPHYIGLNEHLKAIASFLDREAQYLPNVDELRELTKRRNGERALWWAYPAFENRELEACKGLLELAVATDPRIRNWKAYRRFRWKLLLGSRAWSMIQPIVDLAKARAMAADRPRPALEASAPGQ